MTVLWCLLHGDRQRWLEVLNPPKQPQEYLEWDCPRVRVIKDYDAKQVRPPVSVCARVLA